MNARALLEEKRQEVLRVAARHGAHHVRVFGSAARGDDDAQSDIDFLVEVEAGRSLLDIGGLQVELEALLGRPVDVVTERGLKARIRERILREAMPL
jgi:uncharacterized protein